MSKQTPEINWQNFEQSQDSYQSQDFHSGDLGRENFEFSVGQLDPDRWQEYRDLRIQALKEEPLAFEDPEFGLRRLNQRTEQEWRAMLEGRQINGGSGSYLILIAEHDHQIIGGVNASVYDVGQEKIGMIMNMYIAKAVRNKGVGKQLLQSMLKKLSDLKIKKARLEVFTTQEPAINLYKSLGFKILETDIVHTRESELQEYIMEKQLD